MDTKLTQEKDLDLFIQKLISTLQNNKIKNKALANIIKAGKSVSSEEVRREILSMMIKNLDDVSTFEETKNLLVLLLQKYGDDYYNNIYEEILNQGDSSKKIFLQSFLALDKKQINGTFDKFNKLMILRLDENEDIAELAKQVLEKYPFTPTIEDLRSYKYKQFFTTESKDSVDKLCKNISSKIIFYLFYITNLIYIRIHRKFQRRFY